METEVRMFRSSSTSAMVLPTIRSFCCTIGVRNGCPGGPFASLVMVALHHDVSPLLLISDLSEHAKNIKAECRVSLLFDGTPGLDDPLTGPRVTVLGEAVPIEDSRLKARYLARHPSAE